MVSGLFYDGFDYQVPEGVISTRVSLYMIQQNCWKENILIPYSRFTQNTVCTKGGRGMSPITFE